MKSRCIYIFLLLIPCVGCRAQLSAVVFDMETRRPVSNVKVYVNPSGSTLTDSRGRFRFQGKCYSVTFSHVSYESRAMHKSELRDTVWLMPKMNNLDEVVIIGQKPKVSFDMKRLINEASKYGKQPSGMVGVTFDLQSLFDKSQKRKSGKDRERYKKMLDNY